VTTGAAPTGRFLWSHPAHWIALGAGSGLSRRAPGTVGTLWAWAVYLLVQALWAPSDVAWGVAIAATLLLGWWASVVTARHTGVADPGFVVIDEVVAFWLVLWIAMPMGFWGQLAAFALFRYFDAAKPGPVRWADQVFKGWGWRGGWGIMFDDLVAAFCTLLVVAFARSI
jgi:phosphatidylglycerophosphatase A